MVQTVDKDGGLGSSPLTRGKPPEIAQMRRPVGLIPAHAGNAGRSGGRAPDGGAHPRSRGENIGPIVSQVGEVGSSPLTRGKQLQTLAGEWCERLIPAHAGKTGSPTNANG